MIKTVYHVANPKVAGTTEFTKENKYHHHVLVVFEEPVGFTGNPAAGKRKEWYCNKKLLFSSAEEAKLADK